MGLGSFPALERAVRSILPGKGPGGVALLDGIAVKKTEPRLLDRARLGVVFGSFCIGLTATRQVRIEQVTEHASEGLNER